MKLRFCLFLTLAALAAGQHAPPPLPSFAAASIKTLETGPGVNIDEGGNPTHLNFFANVHQFIVEAWGITPKQLGAELGWFSGQDFAIEAVCDKPCGHEEKMLGRVRLPQPLQRPRATARPRADRRPCAAALVHRG